MWKTSYKVLLFPWFWLFPHIPMSTLCHIFGWKLRNPEVSIDDKSESDNIQKIFWAGTFLWISFLILFKPSENKTRNARNYQLMKKIYNPRLSIKSSILFTHWSWIGRVGQIIISKLSLIDVTSHSISELFIIQHMVYFVDPPTSIIFDFYLQHT